MLYNACTQILCFVINSGLCHGLWQFSVNSRKKIFGLNKNGRKAV